jgi:5'-deoxynucleotidase YfbR-like HD superfamily hydrolase
MYNPPYVVKISGSRLDGAAFVGTGFLVDAKGGVITCEHVIHNSQDINVNIGPGLAWKYNLQKSITFGTDDLCLLTPQIKTSLSLSQAILDPEWQASRSKGTELIFYGFSSNENVVDAATMRCSVMGISESEGKIAVAGFINAGDSGAPVVNEFNHVIGIIWAKHTERDGHALVIPIERVVRQMKYGSVLLAEDVWSDSYRKLRKQRENSTSLREVLRQDEVGPYLAWSAVYRMVIQNEAIIRNESPNVFEVLWLSAVESSAKVPLMIDGLPGSGTSQFLDLLYFYAAMKYRAGNSKNPAPFYIDLSQYERNIYKDGTGVSHEAQAREKCRADLQPLVTYLNSIPGANLLLFVNGGESTRWFSSTQQELEEFSKSERVRIICHANIAQWQADLVLRFEASSNVEFIKAYCDAANFNSKNVESLQQQWVELRSAKIDISTLNFMIDRRESDSDAGQQFRSLVDWYESYCHAFVKEQGIKSPSAERELSAAGDFAFIVNIRNKEVPEKLLHEHGVAWALVNTNAVIRSYLAARRVILGLRRYAATGKDATILSYLVSSYINGLCKEIISTKPDLEQIVIKALERAVKTDNIPLKTTITYFAGRLRLEVARKAAREILLSVKRSFASVEPNRADSLGMVERKCSMWKRSTFISLIYLDDRLSSKEYIESMIHDDRADLLNRGFHLEYYGDITMNSWDEYTFTHVDTLADFSYTYRKLLGRIERRFHDDHAKYKLRDVEIYTLLSLSLHRHIKGKLDDDKRLELIELGTRIQRSTVTLPLALRDFVDLAVRDLSETPLALGAFAERLYQLKRTPRAGWVKRSLSCRIESVAEHTFGGFLLGLLYLPTESNVESKYNKNEILMTILVHDLGEAFIGDIVAGAKTPEDVEAERSALSYLSMLGFYPGMPDLSDIQRLWDDFEHSRTYNAKVAKDLDRIENLMQLYVYRKNGQAIDDFKKWRDSLYAQLMTEEGQGIADILRSRFDREGREK